MNILRDLFRSLRSDFDFMELVKGGSIFFAVKIFGTIGAYAFTLLVSRHYGPGGNGTVAFVLTLAVLLSFISNLGLNTYAVKIIPHFIQAKEFLSVRIFYRKSLLSIFVIATGISVLVYFSSHFMPFPGDSSYPAELRLASILTLPLAILLFTSSAFKAIKKITIFSLLQNNVIQFFALIILVLPFWSGSSNSEPVIALCIAAVIFAFSSIISWKVPEQKSFNTPDITFKLPTHLKSAFPMLVGGIAFFILNLTDRLMLRFLDSTENLGIYDVALRIANLTLFGLLSLNAIAEPKFAELHTRGDLKGLKKFVQRSTFLGLIITIPAILIIISFPDFWLGMFGTDGSYLKGEKTLFILCAGNAIGSLCGAVLTLLNMSNRQRKVQNILIFAASINIGLNLILIPHFSIQGAAIATLVSTLIWNFLGLYVVYKDLGFYTFSLK